MNKSLKNALPGKGLPIGNLTSQLFGNVYLNPLDHFIKREIKIRCYGRYVDDMLLVSRSREKLCSSISLVRDFLRNRLGLELHPKKIRLQPVQCGFPFLGAFVLPYRVYPGHRLKANFLKTLWNPPADMELRKDRLVSYVGSLSHFNAVRLIEKIGKTKALKRSYPPRRL